MLYNNITYILLKNIHNFKSTNLYGNTILFNIITSTNLHDRTTI